MFAYFILIAVLVLTGFGSYLISRAVYKKLTNAGNKRANLLRVLTFIFSFLVIFCSIALLFIYNMKFER